MSFSRSFVRRVAQGAGFAFVFSAGYLLGTLDAEPAEAQVGDDMQTHVTELQKNLETLNKIKAALGGT